MNRTITITLPEGPDKSAVFMAYMEKSFCRIIEVLWDIEPGKDRLVIKRLFASEALFCLKRILMLRGVKE